MQLPNEIQALGNKLTDMLPRASKTCCLEYVARLVTRTALQNLLQQKMVRGKRFWRQMEAHFHDFLSSVDRLPNASYDNLAKNPAGNKLRHMDSVGRQ